MMQQGNVSKAEFARIAGVTRSRVSHWISAGELSGDALVRDGRTERVNVEAARRQLGARVDVDQRIAPPRSGRGDTLDAIQRQKLAALELANERARLEAATDTGRYVDAGAAKQEMGKIAGRMVAASGSFRRLPTPSLRGPTYTPSPDAIAMMKSCAAAAAQRTAQETADFIILWGRRARGEVPCEVTAGPKVFVKTSAEEILAAARKRDGK
jgi:hypothetical protein